MKIQVIQYAKGTATEKEGILYSPLSSPRALDDHDINIIDLSNDSLWKYAGKAYIGEIDALSDLSTIQQMVSNKRWAVVLYALPQNADYLYNLSSAYDKRCAPIKDVVEGILRNSITHALPQDAMPFGMAFERTETLINGENYEADFYLTGMGTVVTASERSEKITTVKVSEDVYVTTLKITKSNEALKHFITSIFVEHEREPAPEWMNKILLFDDAVQKEQIEQREREIRAAEAKIQEAEAKLKENQRYKSILYTNGDELVTVVFDILERMLDCDLSTFVDEKKEDFLIKKPSCTFIGEIKGVTSNVKYEHISQVELHYRSYLDKLSEEGTSENVKQLLIMNPFRSKDLAMRDPVHTAQVDLAKRNNCLIIETNTLLRIFERFCDGKITTARCIEVLSRKSGLLSDTDLDESTEDNEPYMI